jgi:signal transduction histidine kinase
MRVNVRPHQRPVIRQAQYPENRFGALEARPAPPRIRELGPANRTVVSTLTTTRQGLLAGAISAIVIASVLVRPAYVVDPGARAAIETVITLSVLATAGLLVVSFRRRSRSTDLLLLCALLGASLADLLYSVVPALAGIRGWDSAHGARAGTELIVALALAAVAFAPSTSTPGSRRRLVGRAVMVSAGLAFVGGLLAQLIIGRRSTAALDAAAGGTAIHPPAVAIYTASAAILVLAGLAFLAGPRPAESATWLVAGAALLLAGANLQYVAIPAVATDWVTRREGLRLGAYALLLGSACLRYAMLRRREMYAAIGSEREKIARDLHDGLAQDLACIAVQGQRLECHLGPEHPLMLAVREAVVATRGVIADLTASAAPTTEAALHVIADELGHRFDLQVDVRIETDTTVGPHRELEPAQREHVIRIAREAIVNAALHGTARHVDVVLRRRGSSFLMRVSDDGRGIAEGQSSGFGLRTMRARAASLGGHLNAHPRAGGGTELELEVS